MPPAASLPRRFLASRRHSPPPPPGLGHGSVTALLQDVDTAFLVKADLETNVEALEHEINFLKALFEEVNLLSARRLIRASSRGAEAGGGAHLASRCISTAIPERKSHGFREWDS